MKKALIVVGAVVLLLLLVIIMVPFFIDANQFKPTIETDLATALGRQVSIGNIKLAIFSGAVTVDDVSIADDPAFSKSPFLTAKQLAVGVAMMPLIFSKRIDIQSLTITDPQVSLVRSATGTWNFSSLGAASSQPKSSGSSATNLSVAKVQNCEWLDCRLHHGARRQAADLSERGSRRVESFLHFRISVHADRQHSRQRHHQARWQGRPD